MIQDEIIRMAREGKSVVEQVHAYVSRNNTDFTSESMAKMVCDFIAAEREACAKVCEARYMGDNNREDMEANDAPQPSERDLLIPVKTLLNWEKRHGCIGRGALGISMGAIILTALQLFELTGRKQKNAQIERLKAAEIPYREMKDRLLVFIAELPGNEQAKNTKQRSPKLRLR